MTASFMWNRCPNRTHSNCAYPRRNYQAQVAQKKYEVVLAELREGPLTKKEFYRTEQIISSAVRAGQNIYLLYKLITLPFQKRQYTAIFYAPTGCKFKPRKQTKGVYIPKGVKIDRGFDDFLLYLEETSLTNYAETDTVIGRIRGQIIMTFQFVNIDFLEFYWKKNRQLKSNKISI